VIEALATGALNIATHPHSAISAQRRHTKVFDIVHRSAVRRGPMIAAAKTDTFVQIPGWSLQACASLLALGGAVRSED
jgi:hypothetical protein